MSRKTLAYDFQLRQIHHGLIKWKSSLFCRIQILPICWF